MTLQELKDKNLKFRFDFSEARKRLSERGLEFCGFLKYIDSSMAIHTLCFCAKKDHKYMYYEIGEQVIFVNWYNEIFELLQDYADLCYQNDKSILRRNFESSEIEITDVNKYRTSIGERSQVENVESNHLDCFEENNNPFTNFFNR